MTVTNIGAVSGADVIQTYVRDPAAASEPPEQLRAFARVFLQPGASRVVTMTIPDESLRIFSDGTFESVPGTYAINVGSSSVEQPIRLAVKIS